MPKCIYIADDEEYTRSLMKTFLENEGFEVRLFADGYSILQAVKERMPDLIILDIMMPGADGLSVCTSIRKKSTVPIMIVSAKDSAMDRVTGIMLGSDDYLVKPFLPLELTARVKALLRRSEISASSASERQSAHYVCGNLELDVRSRKVSVDGLLMAVTPTEFDFLLYLFERIHTAVSKKELLEHVWNYQDTLDDMRMADDLVKRLRKKLKEKHAGAVIETIWGFGYRLTERQEEFRG